LEVKENYPAGSFLVGVKRLKKMIPNKSIINLEDPAQVTDRGWLICFGVT